MLDPYYGTNVAETIPYKGYVIRRHYSGSRDARFRFDYTVTLDGERIDWQRYRTISRAKDAINRHLTD